MKIDLFREYNRNSAIETDSKICELDIDSEEFSSDDVIHVICNMQGNNDLERVEGIVSATAVLECSRCLESFRQNITGDFSFVARHLNKGETFSNYSEIDNNEDENNFIYVAYDEDSIDITKFVHDALLLSIPLKPICNEDCKGLCPVCGNNLNESEFCCNTKSNDPRWQVLSEILNESSEKNKK